MPKIDYEEILFDEYNRGEDEWEWKWIDEMWYQETFWDWQEVMESWSDEIGNTTFF